MNVDAIESIKDDLLKQGVSEYLHNLHIALGEVNSYKKFNYQQEFVLAELYARLYNSSADFELATKEKFDISVLE